MPHWPAVTVLARAREVRRPRLIRSVSAVAAAVLPVAGFGLLHVRGPGDVGGASAALGLGGAAPSPELSSHELMRLSLLRRRRRCHESGLPQCGRASAIGQGRFSSRVMRPQRGSHPSRQSRSRRSRASVRIRLRPLFSEPSPAPSDCNQSWENLGCLGPNVPGPDRPTSDTPKPDTPKPDKPKARHPEARHPEARQALARHPEKPTSPSPTSPSRTSRSPTSPEARQPQARHAEARQPQARQAPSPTLPSPTSRSPTLPSPTSRSPTSPTQVDRRRAPSDRTLIRSSIYADSDPKLRKGRSEVPPISWRHQL